MTQENAAMENTNIPTDGRPTQAGASVWFELPATDLKRAQKFYENVLDIKMIYCEDPEMPNPMVWFCKPDDPGAFGHLYPGKPAAVGTGSSIHMLAADPLETIMERVTAEGGQVMSPAIPIPNIGRFFYALDLDGNSVGFFNFNA